MTAHRLKVMIVGAGTGGLCLAQGLLAAGLDVRLFERDRTPVDRLQGYRLHISATGNRALRSCLPPSVFDHFAAAAAKPNTGVTFLDERLNRLLAIAIPPADPMEPQSEIPISRISLRTILLEGLGEVVAFDNTFQSFEAGPGDRVTARFEDGSSATGDVLIGADGATSRVRAQLLPQARRRDTGLVAISGKFALDEAARRETPPAVFKGPTLILGPRGCFLFASAVEYPPQSSSPYDREEYVMWGFSARRETVGRTGSLDDLTGEAAKALVLAQMDGWHPKLRRMIERAEPGAMTSSAVRSAEPVAPWTTGRVTLLGDALHNMTPFRGMGANVALRDAAALCDALVRVDRGEQDLLPALAAYERDMVDYGFAAVGASLGEMERLHATSPLRRLAAKAVFRMVDTIPALQGMFRGQR
jgi:2-polyprenyl-6-methoxyphenol hydroxylase-like FAD-dependent oxidoreductase